MLLDCSEMKRQTIEVLNGIFLGETQKLANDQMCGLPTGGREECDWDCGDPSICFLFLVYSDPECLRYTIKNFRSKFV